MLFTWIDKLRLIFSTFTSWNETFIIVLLQKLRLFDPDTGDMYPTEASLESLLGDSEGLICNGATVIIEYIRNDAVSEQLTDLQRYTQR